MISLKTKTDKIKGALISLQVPVWRYQAPSNAEPPYIVWYEWSEPSQLSADGRKAEQAISGYVYLYTRQEDDPLVDQVQDALDAATAWRYQSAQWMDPANGDLNAIQHVWSWELA